MPENFLSIIKRMRGDGDYAGDEFGGAGGSDGSGLPTDSPGNFRFATGIECSYPTIQNGTIRRDEMEECGHYERYREDLALVKDLGLKVLRYGLPYHKVHLGPGRFDWEFADLAMGEIRRLGLTPVLDLLHFGVPDWIGDFQNPELPVHFAEYAAAVAERYPWVRRYTPVNEMFVTARVSAKEGKWNEQLKDDRAYITATKHMVAAAILACHEIARRRPDALIIQSESAEFVHDARVSPSPEVKLWNDLRYLALDLLYAREPDANVLLFALDNGMTREEYDWFMTGEPPGYQIVGNDYYGRNERIIKPDGTPCSAEDVLGWYQFAKDFHLRYKKPIAHTETNHFDPDYAECWLWKQWMNVLRLRRDGVPIVAFTWYSLTDQIDWDIELTEKRGTVNACGLYDLERRPRKVAASYRMLIEQFGQITIVPHGEMFDVTDRPARLKVEV